MIRPGHKTDMPLANDLLEQAYHLARREPKKPKQASLRRAVSTAYYALFHLLVSEATRHWTPAHQRSRLARFYEHGKMLNASDKQRAECNKFINARPAPPPGPDLDCMRHLQTVSLAFCQAQQHRHTADYDLAKVWTRTEATQIIDQVDAAFQSWPAIRDHGFAQAYLFSLLGNPKGN
jgi:uncharacterized protein (UPF0332 family)